MDYLGRAFITITKAGHKTKAFENTCYRDFKTIFITLETKETNQNILCLKTASIKAASSSEGI